MTYQQKQTTLQPMEGDISTSPLPFQEHCITALPFITVSDEDNAYALQVAPNCDSATLPQGIENLEGKLSTCHHFLQKAPLHLIVLFAILKHIRLFLIIRPTLLLCRIL